MKINVVSGEEKTFPALFFSLSLSRSRPPPPHPENKKHGAPPLRLLCARSVDVLASMRRLLRSGGLEGGKAAASATGGENAAAAAQRDSGRKVVVIFFCSRTSTQASFTLGFNDYETL